MTLVISFTSVFKQTLASMKVKWDFPGGPVVKTLPSRAGGVGSIPGWGAGIPHATQPKSQNIKKNTVINSVKILKIVVV